jgi:hypothetical protein
MPILGKATLLIRIAEQSPVLYPETADSPFQPSSNFLLFRLSTLRAQIDVYAKYDISLFLAHPTSP